jgi:hypothetical protein
VHNFSLGLILLLKMSYSDLLRNLGFEPDLFGETKAGEEVLRTTSSNRSSSKRFMVTTVIPRLRSYTLHNEAAK